MIGGAFRPVGRVRVCAHLVDGLCIGGEHGPEHKARGLDCRVRG